MSDRYVIVFQDGSFGPEYDRAESDRRLGVIKYGAWPIRTPRPAYRIRIREKPVTEPHSFAPDREWGPEFCTRCGFHVDGHLHKTPRLDATLAYRQVTGREAPG